eukprot:SAG11_NODE_29685_length_308_cov_0.985646_1_plen_31_part_10
MGDKGCGGELTRGAAAAGCEPYDNRSYASRR